MKEEITKITRTIEITEFIISCKNCEKKIKGRSESQVIYNYKLHKEACYGV